MRAQAYWEQSDCASFADKDMTYLFDCVIIWIAKILSLVALLSISTPALGQTAISVSLETDHRYRGRSLSDGRPVVEIAASQDIGNFLYVGASGLATLTGNDRAGPLLAQLYLGIAKALDNNVSADIGVSGYNYTRRSSLNQNVEYFEVYAGLTRGKVSGYLRYSPNHLGSGTPVVYVDLNSSIEIAPDWNFVSHAGALVQSSNGPPRIGGRRIRYDTRFGINRTFNRLEVKTAIIFAGPDDAFFSGPFRGRSAFILSATRHF